MPKCEQTLPSSSVYFPLHIYYPIIFDLSCCYLFPLSFLTLSCFPCYLLLRPTHIMSTATAPHLTSLQLIHITPLLLPYCTAPSSSGVLNGASGGLTIMVHRRTSRTSFISSQSHLIALVLSFAYPTSPSRLFL